MREPDSSAVWRRVVLVAGLSGLSLAVTWASIAALHALTAVYRHRALSWPSLTDLPITRDDLLLAGAVVGFLVTEWFVVGWEQSALRRLLTKRDGSTRADLFYVIVTFTGLFSILVSVTSIGLGVWINNALLRGFGTPFAGDLPLWIACPMVFVLRSFCGYWRHRLTHTALFWPLHATHHAARDLNIVTVLRHHPLELIIGAIFTEFLPALLGFSPEAVIVTRMIESNYTLYMHSGLPSVAWLERYLLFGPRGHGIHHSVEPRHYNSNFSGDLVIWDRLFGTYTMEAPETLIYGLAEHDAIYDTGRPWRDIVTIQALWLRGLWRALPGRGYFSHDPDQANRPPSLQDGQNRDHGIEQEAIFG
jgi:sterol desaturase/sphingolipid hydroxylase (fatty acid hydroxylase superfamily)